MEQNSNDTHTYKGWLNSDSFMKRSFAIFGYNFVANLIIGIIVFFLGFILAIAFGGLAMFSVFSSESEQRNQMMFEESPAVMQESFDEPEETEVMPEQESKPAQESMEEPDPSSQFTNNPNNPLPEDLVTFAQTDFGEPVTLAYDETAYFLDGMHITLFLITEDTGEDQLVASFFLAGGSLGTSFPEIDLGTVRHSSQTVGEYTITLRSATLDTAEIVVTRN
jgi:hypothetical protein